MENSSKALLMAAGILVGVLILTLMVTLFISSKDLSSSYEETKQQQAVQQFNTNFTKYVGQDLTVHQVVTITNFAKENGVLVLLGKNSVDDISKDVAEYTENYIITYKLQILQYSDDGYVKVIAFS